MLCLIKWSILEPKKKILKTIYIYFILLFVCIAKHQHICPINSFPTSDLMFSVVLFLYIHLLLRCGMADLRLTYCVETNIFFPWSLLNVAFLFAISSFGIDSNKKFLYFACPWYDIIFDFVFSAPIFFSFLNRFDAHRFRRISIRLELWW